MDESRRQAWAPLKVRLTIAGLMLACVVAVQLSRIDALFDYAWVCWLSAFVLVNVAGVMAARAHSKYGRAPRRHAS